MYLNAPHSRSRRREAAPHRRNACLRPVIRSLIHFNIYVAAHLIGFHDKAASDLRRRDIGIQARLSSVWNFNGGNGHAVGLLLKAHIIHDNMSRRREAHELGREPSENDVSLFSFKGG